MTPIAFRPSQADVLAYQGGKMGISAVPGSGKTFTLSALAAEIIRAGRLASEQEVLIVTLVNSAVDNFSARIKEFLALPLPFGYRVRTLHGLAHDIVREKPAAVGLEDRFDIIDERESDLIRRESANTWLHANPGGLDEYLNPEVDENRRESIRRQQFPELVSGIALAFIRSAKDNRLTPAALRARLDATPSHLPLAEMGLSIYTDYQRALTYRGAVDFDDLIRLSIDLLENDPEYLERLRYRWPFILEDEAQDSSWLQEQILRLLSGPAGNWVRVGDPNQAIFETFTTASPQHLIDFIHSEANAYRELPFSGRCQPAIIALANQLIHWVNDKHPEDLVRDALTVPLIRVTEPGDPQSNPPDDPRAVKLIGHSYTPEQEIEGVGVSLANWMPGHPDSTVAVLVSRNLRGADVIAELKRREIDFFEILASTSSTRQAAGRLGEILASLSDPQSAIKLARAYQAWRGEQEDEARVDLYRLAAGVVRKCSEMETYISPKGGSDWLETVQPDEIREELGQFRTILRRWQSATLLPIDQLLLTIGQDLFTASSDLALAHKLALVLGQAAEDHPDWRLPELSNELGLIARNERRFLGFSDDDGGFDPSHYPGKVVVTTMHKAKGLEWDRVYMLSVNNYDFPSYQDTDRYISEKWFIRSNLNLEAETLAQLDAALSSGEYEFYAEGQATRAARLNYIRERLRLLYVGITRAKKELIMTWNTGRQGTQTQAIPFAALQAWAEVNLIQAVD